MEEDEENEMFGGLFCEGGVEYEAPSSPPLVQQVVEELPETEFILNNFKQVTNAILFFIKERKGVDEIIDELKGIHAHNITEIKLIKSKKDYILLNTDVTRVLNLPNTSEEAK